MRCLDFRCVDGVGCFGPSTKYFCGRYRKYLEPRECSVCMEVRV